MCKSRNRRIFRRRTSLNWCRHQKRTLDPLCGLIFVPKHFSGEITSFISLSMKNVQISKSVNFSTENITGLVQTPETHSRPIIRSHFCSKTLFWRNNLFYLTFDEKCANIELVEIFE